MKKGRARPLTPQQQRINELAEEVKTLRAEKKYLVDQVAQLTLKLNQANAKLKQQEQGKVLVAKWTGSPSSREGAR